MWDVVAIVYRPNKLDAATDHAFLDLDNTPEANHALPYIPVVISLMAVRLRMRQRT